MKKNNAEDFCAFECPPLSSVMEMKYGELSSKHEDYIERVMRTVEWGMYQDYALAMCERGEMPETFGMWRSGKDKNNEDSE
jgi:hypothetical protein